MNNIKIKDLKCEFEDYILEGDYYYTDNKPISTVLLLHGGGLKTTRRKFDTLRIDLLNKGIESYAFDYVGHGENNEDLYNTSLHSKVLQAKTFIDKHIERPFSIICDSMSGYITIKLTEYYDIASLVFFVPALYTAEAYDVNFGNDFSTIIRKENSWNNSDAFDVINRYKGNILLISAEKDEVVPLALTNRLSHSFSSANKVYEYVVKNGTHHMRSYVYQSGEYEIILKFIMKCLKR